VVRWHPGGALDASFTSSGPYFYTELLVGYEAAGLGIAQQPDGSIYVGGYTASSTSQFAGVAKFLGDEDLIFVDGFETADTLWWSASVP
jgi:hypothetical protein